MLKNKILSASGQGVDPVYVDDVFSTWLQRPTTSNTNYTINSGQDFAGKGGMFWFKARDAASTNNLVYDTVRGASAGANNALITNGTQAQQTANVDFVTPTSTGVTVNFATGGGQLTNNGINYVGWLFRRAEKFFDVVTYTGDGVANRRIPHNLGSVPGFIVTKRTNITSNWLAWHRTLTTTSQFLRLNDTSATTTQTDIWGSSPPTATDFGVDGSSNNQSGSTYVAYLFAHNAGGFGATGNDNVISCGSFTTDSIGSGSATLGFEPQWLLLKQSSGTGGSWLMFDVMRGMPVTTGAAQLQANTSGAEAAIGGDVSPTATGFTTSGQLNSNATYIYIAIRRPMKPPTSGTSVFSPVAYTGTGSNNTVAAGFATDMVIEGNRTSASAGQKFGAWDRMRSVNFLNTTTTAAEVAATTTTIQANPWDSMTGIKVAGTSTLTNASGVTFAYWMFKRAPGFFDEVCYKGGASSSIYTQNHNLGVTPELMIVKRRDVSTANWIVWAGDITKSLILNSTAAVDSASGAAYWNSTNPTATQFSVGGNAAVNNSSSNYVAYLFASCPGVSKVGSYTGNGSSQTIDCGFAAGARFFLVKATSTTGSWWVYDSARGIVAAADPALQLNSTAAEVTSADAVDPTATGIIVNQEATCSINASGVSYIFLAIA